jgi:hypothetical protein
VIRGTRWWWLRQHHRCGCWLTTCCCRSWISWMATHETGCACHARPHTSLCCSVACASRSGCHGRSPRSSSPQGCAHGLSRSAEALHLWPQALPRCRVPLAFRRLQTRGRHRARSWWVANSGDVRVSAPFYRGGAACKRVIGEGIRPAMGAIDVSKVGATSGRR